MPQHYGPRQANYGSLSAYGYQAPTEGLNLTTGAPYQMNYGFGTQPQPQVKKDDDFKLSEYADLGSAAAEAYLGYKNLKLGEEQFDFSKDAFNVNLANQAKLINARLRDQEIARRGFTGQSTDAADLAAYLEPRQVSGKAI